MLEPGCTAGSFSSPKAAARARAEPADIVGDLGERRGIRSERAAQEAYRVARGLGFEVVRRLHEWQTRPPRNLSNSTLGKTRRRIQPGAHRRAAERQFINAAQRRLDALPRRFHLTRIAAELLAHADRDRILQVSPPHLDDVVEFRGLALQRCAEQSHGRQQPRAHGLRGGDVHGRGDHVVTRLPEIHLVVRVGAGHVADHFVGVHIGGGATAGLEDVHQELIVITPFRDLFRRPFDGCRDCCRQAARVAVDIRGRAS